MDANFMRDFYFSPFDEGDNGNRTRRVAEGNYVQTSFGGRTRHPDAFDFIPDFTFDSQGAVSGASTGSDDDGKQIDLSEMCSLFTPNDDLNQPISNPSPAPTLQPFFIDQPLPFPGPITEPVESSYCKGLKVTLPLPPSPTPTAVPLLPTLPETRVEGSSSSAAGSSVIQPGLDFDFDDLAFPRDGKPVSCGLALDDVSLPPLSYSPATTPGTLSLGPETPIEPCPAPPLEHRPSPEVKQEEMESTLKEASCLAFRDLASQQDAMGCPPDAESIPAGMPQLQVPDLSLQGEQHASGAHRHPCSPPEAASLADGPIPEPTQAVKPRGKKDAKRKRTIARSKQPPSSSNAVPLDVSLLTEVTTMVRASHNNAKEFRMVRRREKVVPPGVLGNKLSWYKVGEKSVCPFPAIGDATRTCDEYFIDDRKLAAAHVAAHFQDLGLKAPEGNPNVPCFWPGCMEAPQINNFQRHILDSHLHISWHLCECGGSYSRGQQISNVRRHVGTEMHQAFLRRKAQGLGETKEEGVGVHREGANAEFVQGSSRDGSRPSVDGRAAPSASSGTELRRTGGKKRKPDTQAEGGELEDGPSTRRKKKRSYKGKKPLP